MKVLRKSFDMFLKLFEKSDFIFWKKKQRIYVSIYTRKLITYKENEY